MNTPKRSLVSVFLPVALALSIGGLRVNAAALTLPVNCTSLSINIDTAIYFYNSEGDPVNVTASVVYQNPYVMDPYGVIIGDVDENGVITDPDTGAVIGYVSVGD